MATTSKIRIRLKAYDHKLLDKSAGEIVETAKIAKKNGVKTIALTSEDSPLARLSDVVLHIHTHLENNLHIPMTSRLAHLAIIDILSATVQARFGKVFDSRKDEVIKNIEKTRV